MLGFLLFGYAAGAFDSGCSKGGYVDHKHTMRVIEQARERINYLIEEHNKQLNKESPTN